MISMPQIDTEYDIIIAGGGTAGCLLAGRLAAASPTLTILVLEAGPSTLEILAHIQPARAPSHITPTSTTMQFHKAEKTEAVGGRELVVSCAQCLGGGSSVNFTVYTRASKSDYDDWKNIHGNAGWGSEDLVPLLEKTETYQITPGALTHGYEGPLKVSYGGTYTNVGREFLETAAMYDRERTVGEDPNDLMTVNQYCRWQKWIDNTTGRRSDVPHHFIYNQAHNERLHVVTSVYIHRVRIEGTRATGIEYRWNKRFLSRADDEVHFVRARRLVVVSAGTFGSPGILERSGVGAAEVLRKNSVPEIVDLPGVGEAYQDHPSLFVPYVAAPEAETIDAIIRNDPDEIELTSNQWLKDGQGLMAHCGIDAGVKIRPSAHELESWGPEFKERWESHFASAPDRPVFLLASLSMFVGDLSTAEKQKYYTLAYYVGHPLARGHVHITSGTDADAPIDFKHGYLEDMVDVRPLMWAYKFSRELARRMPLFRGEYAPLHPKFPEGSAAQVCVKRDGIEAGPVPINAPDLVYGEEDDQAIEKFIRESVTTAWHALGTCAMKPRDAGGVVDSRLNVYGVEGLKIADLSICPGNVSANTYSTALVVGEKAAVIIAEELGITGV
ncbi:GMC oxidoreductase 6 [Heterobasidion irregulare TC 32-1]|uniref:GMC oxidoreductase 6 n=1 Tax=Heterobasidion irregulare (strain TC 32-1) TaxID=747525 RepID=W4KE88_HETIT|nr:GMC oxidoreductase 6 [Heterobasidion irregulare TC 32-1]ETW83635.1 GMC oxidoreductase 6 [Heterobasidion irregulare TC 32-1]